MSRRAYWSVGSLQRPAWGGHVSIIRGEEPPAGGKAWEDLEGREIVFCYEHKIQTNEKHFWLPVFCESLGDIRESLGLFREPEYPLHLTFAVVEG